MSVLSPDVAADPHPSDLGLLWVVEMGVVVSSQFEGSRVVVDSRDTVHEG